MVRTNEIHLVPENTGVYLIKDSDGKVLYVGKANNLRTRVRSHLQGAPGSGGFHMSFVPYVHEISYIVTDNDIEALLLEHNLIKEHTPRFNVKLKDDKRYPYIKVTVGEQFPRVYLTRTVSKGKSKYFGPYPHVKEARTTLKALREVLPLRRCRLSQRQLEKRTRPCLNFQMHQCIGPCSKNVSSEEYDTLVKGVLDFLKGRVRNLETTISHRMKTAAAGQQYEKAAVYRDILQAIQMTSSQQRVNVMQQTSEDYIGVNTFGDVSCVSVMKNRQGRLVSGEYYFLENWEESQTNEQVRMFLRDYYAFSTDVPHEILLPCQVRDHDSLQNLLEQHSGHSLLLHVPQRGRKARTLELARSNARFRAMEKYMKSHGLRNSVDPAVAALQQVLSMDCPPMRIEGYDISTISGQDAVGSMVVFNNGQASKSHYRRFKIKQEGTVDDYAMMKEMLQRRLTHTDEKFGQRPDLILIDGGKGHLNAALETLQTMELETIRAISIAKQNEDVFLPGEPYPLSLDQSSPPLQLLQRIRDEAHRFAQDYHHRLRNRRVRSSALDSIPGIGKQRKQALLRHFGSLGKLTNASGKEIATVPGIGPELALKITNSLRNGLKHGVDKGT